MLGSLIRVDIVTLDGELLQKGLKHDSTKVIFVDYQYLAADGADIAKKVTLTAIV